MCLLKWTIPMKTASWDVWTKSNNHWWCKINLKMYLLFFFTSVVLSVGVALHPFLWPNVCVTHEKNSSKIKKIRKLVPDMIFYFLSLVPCLVAFEEWEKKFMYSCRAWILLVFLVSFMKWEKKKIHFCIIFVSRRMCGAKLEIVCKKWCHMKNVVAQINWISHMN